MNRVNLIPAYRLQAKRRRRRLRFWIAACVACTVLLAALCGACYAVFTDDDLALTGELRETVERIGKSRAAIAAARSSLTRAEVKLASNRAVGNQPDWSILLASVATKLGDDIVLRQCHLGQGNTETLQRPTRRRGPAPTRAAGNAGGEMLPRTLQLIGFGRSHQAVSQFVLRLEAIPIFKKVRVVRNSRQPFLADTAVAFTVACDIDDQEGT